MTELDPSRPRAHACIACRVLESEVEAIVSRPPPDGMRWPEVHWIDQGLHDEPDELRRTVQGVLDGLQERDEIDAVCLAFGVCSRGTLGLTSRRLPVVLPRAHDCITLLLGDRHRYDQYTRAHPGTYWYSPGWIECTTMPGKQRYDKLRAQYVERYGEDNADFLMESEQHWFGTYNRATYVSLTVNGDDARGRQYTRDCADWLGWGYDEQDGNATLMRDLLGGRWDDERFLTIPPGGEATLSADADVVRLEPDGTHD